MLVVEEPEDLSAGVHGLGEHGRGCLDHDLACSQVHHLFSQVVVLNLSLSRQLVGECGVECLDDALDLLDTGRDSRPVRRDAGDGCREVTSGDIRVGAKNVRACLLYTSPSPRD